MNNAYQLGSKGNSVTRVIRAIIVTTVIRIISVQKVRWAIRISGAITVIQLSGGHTSHTVMVIRVVTRGYHGR